jgi:hypothetical protein
MAEIVVFLISGQPGASGRQNVAALIRTGRHQTAEEIAEYKSKISSESHERVRRCPPDRPHFLTQRVKS